MDFALTTDEIRVLGVLIEKERTTPDYYPLTLNALTTACNQKTNREPVVSYSAAHVQRVLDGLDKKRLVGTTTGEGGRAVRYRHALGAALQLADDALALMCLLMLRGAQTPGELRTRSTRLFPFQDVNDVEVALSRLVERTNPVLVRRLGRRPGQKEERYTHGFGDEPGPDIESGDQAESAASLEEKIDDLLKRLNELERAFEAFRRQFE